MSESILQTFLNKQFIKTSDAGNIDSLNKAVTALKNNLTKKRQLIIPYTLIALDPQVSEEDPSVAEVESVIIKNWPTFKNSTSTKDKPTTYVRVVILQALAEIAKDETIGAIIWLTGRNVLAFYQTQKEREPMITLLKDIGFRYERDSRKYWSLNDSSISSFTTPKNISLTYTKFSPIDKTELTNHLLAAAVHNAWVEQAGKAENPYVSNQGNWQWPKFFAERAGKGLTEMFNKAFTSQEQSLATVAGSLQKEVNEYLGQFQVHFETVAKSLNLSSVAANKRNDLLWWKQTMFSPILNDTYRIQDPILTAISMTVDLSNLVGSMYPESVNYLLREALRDVYGESSNEKQSFSVWIESILKLSGSLGEIINPFENNGAGRKSLGSAVANAILSHDGSKFSKETGIDLGQQLSLADLAVWLFHDLQALKISTQR